MAKKPTPIWVQRISKHLPWMIAGGVFITLYIGGLFAQSMNQITGEADFSFGPITCLLANFRYGPYGLIIMLMLYGCIGGWALLRYKDKHSRDTISDTRGFQIDKSGTYGTSQLLSMEEAREYVEVEPLEKTSGFILGKFTSEGHEDAIDKIVSVPPDGKRFAYDALGRPVMESRPDGERVQKRERLSFNGNRHVMVLGPSGSGKSWCYSRPNIFQSILHGESVVVTDPKGELYADTSEYARDHGYIVRILNLAWPNGSDALDFLSEVRGDQIGIEAQDFANIVIENTENPNSKGDAAYTNGEKNLLQALVLFVLTAPNCPYPRTLGGVYQLLCEPLDSIDMRFSMLPAGNPALAPWSIFKDGSDAFKGNLRTGLGNRLTVMNDEIIKNITGNKEIDLVLPGQTKCIYYVIMSDMNNTFRFISSLFFTYLFNRLVEYSRKQPDLRLPVPVNVIMDEFIASATRS